MYRIFSAALLANSIFFGPTLAQDASVCLPVIETGLRDYRADYQSDDELDQVYDHFCRNSFTKSDRSWSFGASAVVKKIPINLTGGSSDSSTAMDSFCRNYQSTRENRKVRDLRTSTIQSKGYDAFVDCLRIAQSKSYITHAISGLQLASIYVKPDVLTPVIINGITASGSLSCTPQTAERKIPASGLTVKGEPLAISCIRSVEKSGNLLYREADVIVASNLGPYRFSMPAVSTDAFEKSVKEDAKKEAYDRFSVLLNALVPQEISIETSKSVVEGGTETITLGCPAGWSAKSAKLIQPVYEPFQRVSVNPVTNGFVITAFNRAGSHRGDQLMLGQIICLRPQLMP